MKSLVDNWSVVLLGHWNSMIFTPAWIGRVLGPGPVKLEFPVGNPLLPVRYTQSGVRLVVTDDRLIFGPTEDSPEVLQRIETSAMKVLRDLPHTPVTAVGINFEFEEQDPPPEVTNLLKPSDLPKLASTEFAVERTALTRQVRGSQEVVLNVTFAQDLGGPVVASLNFHHEVKSAEDAATHLDGRVLQSRRMATDFLREVYLLELDGGADV